MTVESQNTETCVQDNLKNLLSKMKDRLGLSEETFEFESTDKRFAITSDGFISITQHLTQPQIKAAKTLGFTVRNFETIIIDPKISTKQATFLLIKNTLSLIPQEYKELFVYPALKNLFNYFQKTYEEEILSALPENILSKLYPFQKEDSRLLIYRKYNLLAFDQGLGKSITSIIPSLLLTSINQTLIVCKTNKVWELYEEFINDWQIDADEISAFDSKHSIFGKTERFFITTYEGLTKYRDYLVNDLKIDYVIIDEGQMIKNDETQRFQSLSIVLEKHNPKITILTGTPITNTVDDLFPQLKILKHDIGKDKAAFFRLYTHRASSGYGKKEYTVYPKNLELLSFLTSNIIIRRLKKDCDVNLPAKDVKQLLLNVSKVKYHGLVDSGGEALFDKTETVVEEHDVLRRISATMLKAEALIPYLEERFFNDPFEKIIVFSQWNKPLRLLHEYFKENSLLVCGNLDGKKKSEYRNRFRKDIQKNLYLANILSEGVGANLQFCHVLYVLGLPYNATDIQQAIARIDRLGQQEEMYIRYCIAPGTIDIDDLRRLDRKSKNLGKIIKSDKDTISFTGIEKEQTNYKQGELSI